MEMIDILCVRRELELREDGVWISIPHCKSFYDYPTRARVGSDVRGNINVKPLTKMKIKRFGAVTQHVCNLHTQTQTHHLQFKGQKTQTIGGSFSTLGCCFATLMKLTMKKELSKPPWPTGRFLNLNERLRNGFFFFTYTPRHVKTTNATVDFFFTEISMHSRRHKYKSETLCDSVDDVLSLRMRICLCVCVCNTSNVNRLLWKRKFIAPGYQKKKRPLSSSTTTSSVTISLGISNLFILKRHHFPIGTSKRIFFKCFNHKIMIVYYYGIKKFKWISILLHFLK